MFQLFKDLTKVQNGSESGSARRNPFKEILNALHSSFPSNSNSQQQSETLLVLLLSYGKFVLQFNY